jgi:CRP-like cAMP-binding protein
MSTGDSEATRVNALTQFLMFTEDAVAFQEGEVIFREGEEARAMYIVRDGSVDLRRGDDLLETLRPGAVFGEMALVDPAPRSATAIAGAGCQLVALDEQAFRLLVQRVPGFALELLRVVVQRLRLVSERK